MKAVVEGSLYPQYVPQDVWLNVIAPYLSVPDKIHFGFCSKWLYNVFCVKDERVQNWKHWHSLTCLEAAFEAAYFGDVEQMKICINRIKKEIVIMGKGQARYRFGKRENMTEEIFSFRIAEITKSAAIGNHMDIAINFYRSMALRMSFWRYQGYDEDLDAWEKEVRKNGLITMPRHTKPNMDLRDLAFLRACNQGFIPMIKCVVENTSVDNEILEGAIFQSRFNREVQCYLLKKRWSNWKESQKKKRKRLKRINVW